MAVARARTAIKVRLSAQPPADRSVQRLRPRRRRTAPADRWAVRRHSCPPSARQRAQTDAAPCFTSLPPKGPGGRHRRRGALPVPLAPVTPRPPREGALPLALLLEVSGFAAPACSVWRHRRAALGFLRRPGSPRATESGSARPAPVPLRSFLPPWIFRRVLRGGSGVSRPSPPGGAAPQS